MKINISISNQKLFNYKNRGFTLIEVMIALLIFAIVALMVVVGLRSILNSASSLEQQASTLANLQTAMLIMDHDFTQVVDRPILDQNNNTVASFVGTANAVEFTHNGYLNPLAQFPRGTLQRVEYFQQGNLLIRRSWPVLDRTPQTQPIDRVLLSQVSSIAFIYYGPNLSSSSQWPLTQTIQSAQTSQTSQNTTNSQQSSQRGSQQTLQQSSQQIPQQFAQRFSHQQNNQTQNSSTQNNPSQSAQTQNTASQTTTPAQNQNGSTATNNEPNPLPKAMEIIITLNKLGVLHRIYIISEAV